VSNHRWRGREGRHHTGGSAINLWWGNTNRNQIGSSNDTALSISGNATPLAGNYDGDTFDDILFYTPGSVTDQLWWGTLRPLFGTTNSTATVNINGTYTPTVGDYDGNSRSDIIWHQPQ
jgi:hypothetical protein